MESRKWHLIYSLEGRLAALWRRESGGVVRGSRDSC